METKYLIVLLVSLLIFPFFLNYCFLVSNSTKEERPDFFLGVDVAYEDLVEIKKLIDEVSSYTNLFVIGCTGVTHNNTKLDETCQYIYDKGLSFIVFREIAIRTEWLETAKERWGYRFLGIYAFDEAGGWHLDLRKYRLVVDADNHTDAANQFTNGLNRVLNRFKMYYSNLTYYPIFTSDYALYWFDYKAGYDVLLAQFGWNYSRQLNVALCRGAATMQNKDWGVMITWTYTQPPDNESYLESGDELYDDLVLAYESGAEYILVFDTNENYTQSTLKKEHLDALKRFWQYATDNPRPSTPPSDRVAYVLPKDYGYGFRGPNDTIWGLWGAAEYEHSLKISTEVGALIREYQNRLDIIYDDELKANSSYGYSKLIFWNGTVWVP